MSSATRMAERPAAAVSPRSSPAPTLADVGSCLAGAVAPLVWILANAGHLFVAMRLLAVASFVMGLTIFVAHGRRVITAAGIYALAAGVMAGSGAWYWASNVPADTTERGVFLASLSIYVSTGLMYFFFWRAIRLPDEGSSASRSINPADARSLAIIGIVLFLVGAAAYRSGLSLGGLPDSSAEMGITLFAAALVLTGDRHFLRSPMRTALIGAAMLSYYVVVFSGNGRLRLAAVAATVAIVSQARRTVRIKGVAVAALVPLIVIFAVIGQERVAASRLNQTYQAPASGLGSLVNPLDHYGSLITGHITDGHGSTLAAEVVLPVPRSVWPGKPVQLGRVLAYRLVPQVAAVSNESVVVTTPGEWYYNFGWPGVLLMILVVGLIVRWLDLWIARRRVGGLPNRSTMLGFVALSVLVGSVTDLAWGGTATWTNRDLQRVLILVPLVLWSVAASRADRRVSRRPVRAPMRRERVIPRSNLGAELAARVADADLAFAGGLSGATVAAAIDSSRPAAARRAVAFVIDEGLSSVQNFAIMLVAIRYLTLPQLGVFALVYNGALLTETLLRSLVLTPLSVEYSHSDERTRRNAASRALGASALLGAACVGIGGIAGVIAPSHYRSELFAVGVAVLALITQESWRVLFFTAATPWRAVVNDAACLVTTVLALAVVIEEHGAPSAELLLLVWAIGTAAGSGLGFVQARVVPRLGAGMGWVREHWLLGSRLAAGQGAERFAGQLASGSTAAIAGAVALGTISASRTLFSPFTTVIAAVSTFALPEASRLYRRGDSGFNRLLVGVSSLLAVGCAAFGLGLYLLPDDLGRRLAGSNWSAAQAQLTAVAIWTIGSGLRIGPLIGLQVLRQAREVLRLSIVTGVTTLAAVAAGSAVAGVSGAAWAFAGINVAVATLYWVVFASRHRAHRSPAGVFAPGDGPVHAQA